MQNVTVKYYKTGSIVEHWHCGKAGNCVRCKEYKVLDRHHVRTKSRGGMKTVGVCRECHEWIGKNIEKATKLGLYMKGYGKEIQSSEIDTNSKRKRPRKSGGRNQ